MSPGSTPNTPLPADSLSTREAASILGIHVSTLNLWAREGRIAHQRTIKGGHRRYRRADVEALAREMTIPATP